MYWTHNSMNNLLSYYGLVNARIGASEKDLSVAVLVILVIKLKGCLSETPFSTLLGWKTLHPQTFQLQLLTFLLNSFHFWLFKKGPEKCCIENFGVEVSWILRFHFIIWFLVFPIPNTDKFFFIILKHNISSAAGYDWSFVKLCGEY